VYGVSYRARAVNSNARKPLTTEGTKDQEGPPTDVLLREPSCPSWLKVFPCGKMNSNPMPKFEHHIFVCGNQRPEGHPRGCCDPSAEARLQKLFKQKLAARGLKGRIRANQSGCLDQCEHGPNIVIYPDAVWYGNVSESDVDEIIESHIISGRPVERLRLKNECLNTQACEHRPPKA